MLLSMTYTLFAIANLAYEDVEDVQTITPKAAKSKSQTKPVRKTPSNKDDSIDGRKRSVCTPCGVAQKSYFLPHIMTGDVTVRALEIV